MNANKTESKCLKREGTTLNGELLQLVDKFSDLGNSILSTKINASISPMEVSIANNRFINQREIKSLRYYKTGFLAGFSCVRITVWLYHTDTNDMQGENKTDGNYTRKLRTVLNKSWKRHPTRQQVFGQLPPISQVRRTRHADTAGEARINSLATFFYGHTSVGRLVTTDILQLCTDIECKLEHPLGVNDGRDRWGERFMEIRAIYVI